MSTIAIRPDTPPLQVDPSGAVRIGTSQVLLETIVEAFEQGETPEGLAQRFPSLSLPDVYSVIGYYLKHTQDVAAYLAGRDRQSEAVRHRIEEAQGSMKDVRKRLIARRGGQRP